jgi:exosortase
MRTMADSGPVLVAGGERVRHPLWWWKAAALLVLVAILYKDISIALVRQWWDDPNFSLGFFVPLLSANLVWQRREKLAGLPLKPSWWGLAVMLGAIGILIVGTFGSELFLSRSSLLFLLAGLIILFLGWAHFRALIFPWAFLFLMIPVPTLILNEVTLPLQFLASNLGASLLRLVGVPVLREGNVIQLPSITLEVAEACSGVRSLVSLITLAIVYGCLVDKENKETMIRILLVISAVPIAIAANVLRIVGTGLAAGYWSPVKAEGFFHEFSGVVIFIISLLILFGVHQLLGLGARWWRRRQA